MTELPGNVGFASPMTERELSSTRNVAVELLATVALAVSLVIAGTAVSIGMARAQVLHAAIGHSALMPATWMIGHHLAASAL
jgi:hypothetical protein